MLCVDEEDVGDQLDSVVVDMMFSLVIVLDGVSVLVIFDYVKGVLIEDVIVWVCVFVSEWDLLVVVDFKVCDLLCYCGVIVVILNVKEIEEVIG